MHHKGFLNLIVKTLWPCRKKLVFIDDRLRDRFICKWYWI